jgi:hypothetical protein
MSGAYTYTLRSSVLGTRLSPRGRAKEITSCTVHYEDHIEIKDLVNKGGRPAKQRAVSEKAILRLMEKIDGDGKSYPVSQGDLKANTIDISVLKYVLESDLADYWKSDQVDGACSNDPMPSRERSRLREAKRKLQEDGIIGKSEGMLWLDEWRA